jgi:hypothetical protein
MAESQETPAGPDLTQGIPLAELTDGRMVGACRRRAGATRAPGQRSGRLFDGGVRNSRSPFRQAPDNSDGLHWRRVYPGRASHRVRRCYRSRCTQCSDGRGRGLPASRTPACSTSYANRCSSRPPPPTCSRSSAARRLVCTRFSRPWPRAPCGYARPRGHSFSGLTVSFSAR